MLQIVTAKKGELYCPKTKQCFGEKYYTLLTDTSDLIRRLQSTASADADSNSAGIVVVEPSPTGVGTPADLKKLKALVDGDTFPGSGVKTKSVIAECLGNQIGLWINAFPEVFDFLRPQKPAQEAPVVEPEKPTRGRGGAREI